MRDKGLKSGLGSELGQGGNNSLPMATLWPTAKWLKAFNSMALSRIKMLGPRIPKLSGRTVAMPPKQAAPIYLTAEHQAWAEIVKKRAGYRCQSCGKAGVRLFADHIRELRDGGEPLDPINGQCLCGSCHTRKTIGERAKRL